MEKRQWGQGPFTSPSLHLTWVLLLPKCGPEGAPPLSLPSPERFPGTLCVSALAVVHWRDCRASHPIPQPPWESPRPWRHRDLGLALA